MLENSCCWFWTIDYGYYSLRIDLLTRNTLVLGWILSSANFFVFLYLLIPSLILMNIPSLQTAVSTSLFKQLLSLNVYSKYLWMNISIWVYERLPAFLCIHVHVVRMYLSFTGALLISGIYDLQPLVPSSINDPLKMTEYVYLIHIWSYP